MLIPVQIDTLRTFVLFTGYYNVFLSLFLLYPPLYRALGLNISQSIWGWLLATFLAFTAAILILSARDIKGRASIIYWEAILRFAAALLLIPAGLFGEAGLIAAVLGAGDAFIGYVYAFGLVRTLQVTHGQLLLDKF